MPINEEYMAEDRAVRGRFLHLRIRCPDMEREFVAGLLFLPLPRFTLALALRTLPSAISSVLRMPSSEHVSPLPESFLVPHIQGPTSKFLILHL